MPCYHPITAFRSRRPNRNGKHPLVFDKTDALADGTQPLTIPCQQCAGCRLEYARQWALRCHHEASLYDQNSFITLTYDDDHLPRDLSLHYEHFQKFMKRLRARYSGRRIRFFMSGEYGEKTLRPHYHAIIFNLDFEDKLFLKRRGEYTYYYSPQLEDLWPFGFNVIGNVTFQSASYVARYIMKKQRGNNDGPSPYDRVDDQTGEIFRVEKEFSRSSLRPGIGGDWFKSFRSDCYPKDSVSLDGRLVTPPKFYDRLLERDEPELLKQLKQKRIRKAVAATKGEDWIRLHHKEKAKLGQISSLKRGQ